MKNILYFLTAFAFVSATYANNPNSKSFTVIKFNDLEILEKLQAILKELDISDLQKVAFYTPKEAQEATKGFDIAIQYLSVLMPNLGLEKKSFDDQVQLLSFLQKKTKNFSMADELDLDTLKTLMNVYSNLSPQDVQIFLNS